MGSGRSALVVGCDWATSSHVRCEGRESCSSGHDMRGEIGSDEARLKVHSSLSSPNEHREERQCDTHDNATAAKRQAKRHPSAIERIGQTQITSMKPLGARVCVTQSTVCEFISTVGNSVAALDREPSRIAQSCTPQEKHPRGTWNARRKSMLCVFRQLTSHSKMVEVVRMPFAELERVS